MVTYTIDELLLLRKEKACIGVTSGAYLICNTTKQKYYVGQSEKPVDRVSLHFTGRGNGDVYVDYKNGDAFTVRFYDLDTNHFRDLNELEYHLIRIYEARSKGYNRQGGNTTRQQKRVHIGLGVDNE